MLVRVSPVSGERAKGYSLERGPEGTVERETFKCAHCQYITEIVKGADIGKMCMPCGRMICVRCVRRGVCEPYEQAIEKALARARLLEAAGGA
jgi:hypothetical protein